MRSIERIPFRILPLKLFDYEECPHSQELGEVEGAIQAPARNLGRRWSKSLSVVSRCAWITLAEAAIHRSFFHHYEVNQPALIEAWCEAGCPTHFGYQAAMSHTEIAVVAA